MDASSSCGVKLEVDSIGMKQLEIAAIEIAFHTAKGCAITKPIFLGLSRKGLETLSLEFSNRGLVLIRIQRYFENAKEVVVEPIHASLVNENADWVQHFYDHLEDALGNYGLNMAMNSQ